MCGITGFLDPRAESSQDALERIAAAMAEPLRLRGPDAGGVWADEKAGIAFGHRRLSIVDLSPAGAQPMVSSSGRSVLCYNGEIYNSDELRPLLMSRGVRFRGRSDTEVILEACEAWGPEETAKRLIGMFAFAWWDAHAHRLFLVRDRLGIKPLYWAQVNGTLLFASQPKSFFAHPAWKPVLDRTTLAAYFRFGYVPGTRSIYRDVKQVLPGTVLSIARSGETRAMKFWDAQEIAQAGVAQRFSGRFADATEALDALLRDAVAKRMIADVPLGAFLSGGIDSSTVVALMQAQSTRPVKTFSIGFDDAAYDEAPFAKTVAAHLGTEHHELYVPGRAALDTIPTLAEWYDEPFADASQIPTLLVSQMTRAHVTVALSGDGGDELFGGYPRYDFAQRLEQMVERVPPSLRRLGAKGARTLSPRAWEKLAALVIGPARAARFGERLHKASHVLESDSAAALYRDIVSLWLEPEALVRQAEEPIDPLWQSRALLPGGAAREAMQLTDLVTYLPDDILAKVDRASMAVSLEARVPLLDHRVVAFAWSLPPAFKHQNGRSKRVLRAVLGRYVPPSLSERPKRGFEIPLAVWLRGPLRDWAEALLAPAALEKDGVLTSRPIRAAWEAHGAGRVNLHNRLWAVLMFQQWRARWKPSV